MLDECLFLENKTPPWPHHPNSALLRRFFYKNRHLLRSLAPLLQIGPATLGFDLVLGVNLEAGAYILPKERHDFRRVFLLGFRPTLWHLFRSETGP